MVIFIIVDIFKSQTLKVLYRKTANKCRQHFIRTQTSEPPSIFRGWRFFEAQPLSEQ